MTPSPRHLAARRRARGARSRCACARRAGAGAMTSHAGWPPDQHLVMDKGPAGPPARARGQAATCTTTCSAATATTRSTAAKPAT